MNWVITSDAGRTSLSQDMGFVTPFDTFTDEYQAQNPLVAAANEYIEAGKESVAWCFTTMPSENWKNGLGSALLEYAQGTGDWDAVKTAFVDGWATEYAEMNNRLFIEEETMKRLGKRLDSYENLARSSASERLDIMEMRRCNEAIDIIKNQMTQQAVRIRIAQRNVDNAMKKLTEAVQDRKIHEKLKEKAFEQFKLDINAQEMKEIDETVSFKYNNKDE